MDATARDSDLIQPADTNGLDHLFVQPGPDMSTLDPVCPDRPPSPADWWTLTEATLALNVNERTLRRWIKQGKIEAKKVQGVWGEEWRIMPRACPIHCGHGARTRHARPESGMSGSPTPPRQFDRAVC